MKAYSPRRPTCCASTRRTCANTSVLNVCGVLITTNHKTDGIFLPADDRRHYVAWSERPRTTSPKPTGTSSGAGTTSGGVGHVAAYLAELDLSGFNPKAPPPKTPRLLGDRRRQPRAGGRRARRRPRQARTQPDAVTAAHTLSINGGRRALGSGSGTARTGADPAPASSSAAMSQFATPPPTTACGRSKASGRSSTPRPYCRAGISWPPQASWRLASGGTGSSGVGEVSDPPLSPSRVCALCENRRQAGVGLKGGKWKTTDYTDFTDRCRLGGPKFPR